MTPYPFQCFRLPFAPVIPFSRQREKEQNLWAAVDRRFNGCFISTPQKEGYPSHWAGRSRSTRYRHHVCADPPARSQLFNLACGIQNHTQALFWIIHVCPEPCLIRADYPFCVQAQARNLDEGLITCYTILQTRAQTDGHKDYVSETA
ncbi:hypothetical protein Bbelb_300430 [Branchiostoma belcheri]|nr:hypothetical protein Bbelb_300430 [Branchiostoma belcheri]